MDNIEKVILDDSQIVNALETIIKKTGQADKAMDELNDEIGENSKKASDKFKKSNKEIADSLDKTAESQRKAVMNTKENIKSTKFFGVSLNDVNQKVKSYKDGLIATFKVMTNFNKLSINQKRGVVNLSKAMGGGRAGMILFAKSINLVKTALIASGIGLAIVAIGSLAAALTTSQKGMDKLGQATSYLGGAFDVVTDKAASLGNELLDSFSNGNLLETAAGKVKGFFTSVFTGKIIDDIKETAKEMHEVGKASAAITKEMQSLAKSEARLAVAVAKSGQEIKRLKLIGEDRTKGLEAQTKAIKTALSIEQSQIKTRIANAQQELELVKRKNALTTSTEADLQKEFDIEVKIANLQAESYEKQIELNNKVNALVKEYQDKIIAAGVKIKQITKDVISLGIESQIIGDQEAWQFTNDSQIENLKALKMELTELAKLTGTDVTKQVEVLDQAIEALSNRDFVPNIDPLNVSKKLKAITSNTAGGNITLDAEIAIPPEAEQEFLEGISSFEDAMNAALDSIFSDQNSDKARQFIAGLGTLLGEFSGILDEMNQAQIDSIDSQLEELQEKREDLQIGLDDELADQEKGLANSVSTKQTTVDSLIAEEARLQAEREKITQAAQKRQLVLDSITQTQSLVTSGINIIKGFSQIPIIGLPLGIAAVGTLAAFFAKSKVDAVKATRLSTGANKISDHFGFGERHGETDLNNGPGYTLVNNRTGKSTNTIISGKEMLLTENVSISNEQFFDSLKNGLSSGIDLNEAMSFYKQHSTTAIKKSTSVADGKVFKSQGGKLQIIKQYVPFIDKNGKQKAVLVTINPSDRDGNTIELA